MKGFCIKCQGASHVKIDKVCQDESFCDASPELSIALISDGHGGDRYFRSDIGAKLACEVATAMIRQFVSTINISNPNLFSGFGLSQCGINDDIPNKSTKDQFDALRQLGASIISNWRSKITDHANTHPLTEDEAKIVPVEYHSQLNEEDKIAKVYGCTLIGYVQTPTYWFAFHIGDGKCFSFHEETGPKQPVLWDDACFLNKTTSLCDSNALEEFRYTFQGDGTFPYAVFMGSDGLDDSFGEDKNLINFYIQVLKLAYKSGADEVKEILAQDLPTLSSRGSQDDMSISAIYDETKGATAIKELTEWQLNTILGELNQNKARIHRFHKERKLLFDVKKENQKAAIDYDYAVKEIHSAIDIRKKLIERYNNLAKELSSDCPKLFIDDIPYEKVVPIEDAHNEVGDNGIPEADTNDIDATRVTTVEHKPRHMHQKGFLLRKSKKAIAKVKKKKKRKSKH